MKTKYLFDHISLISAHNEKFFRQEFYRKSKHILYSVTFFENCFVYEKMWKNTVERGRP